MAESFENLDNILRDWAKDKRQRSLPEALKIKPFLLKKSNQEKCSRAESQSGGSRARLNQTQNWSW